MSMTWSGFWVTLLDRHAGLEDLKDNDGGIAERLTIARIQVQREFWMDSSR